jgi:Flp pilus assembly pilin Flp
MTIVNTLKSFMRDEAGAVTVDWVVLTGAVVGLGIVVMDIVGTGIEDLGQKIVDDLNARNVGYVSP